MDLPITNEKTNEKPILRMGSTVFVLLVVMALAQIVFLILNVVIAFIIEGSSITLSEEEGNTLNLILNIVIDIVSILFILVVYTRREFPYEPTKPITPRSENVVLEIGQLFSIAILWGTAVGLIATTIYVWIFGTTPDTTSPYEGFMTSIFLLTLFFCAAVIVAPVFEELLFRKYSITCLESEQVKTGVALVLSSVFFGLIHTTSDLVAGSVFFAIVHLLNTSMNGFILGFLYLKTREIKYPIILHALINGYALLNVFLASDIQSLTGILLAMTAVLIMFGIMGIGCLSLAMRIWQNRLLIPEWISKFLESIPDYLTVSSLAMLGGAVVLVVGIPVLLDTSLGGLGIIYYIIRGGYWIIIFIVSFLFVYSLQKK